MCGQVQVLWKRVPHASDAFSTTPVGVERRSHHEPCCSRSPDWVSRLTRSDLPVPRIASAGPATRPSWDIRLLYDGECPLCLKVSISLWLVIHGWLEWGCNRPIRVRHSPASAYLLSVECDAAVGGICRSRPREQMDELVPCPLAYTPG
jgi:hypothetical protein